MSQEELFQKKQMELSIAKEKRLATFRKLVEDLDQDSSATEKVGELIENFLVVLNEKGLIRQVGIRQLFFSEIERLDL